MSDMPTAMPGLDTPATAPCSPGEQENQLPDFAPFRGDNNEPSGLTLAPEADTRYDVYAFDVAEGQGPASSALGGIDIEYVNGC